MHKTKHVYVCMYICMYNLAPCSLTEGISYLYKHIVPLYERLSRYKIPQHSDPDHHHHHLNDLNDLSGDLSGDFGLPTDPSNDLSDPSYMPDDPNTSIVTSSNTHDLTKPRRISVTHQHDLKNSRKVTRKLNDLKKPKKVKISYPDDLINPRKVTCVDQYDQHHLEDDLEDDLMNFDLSDPEDDLASESDFYDLENASLGQLLGRNTRD